MPVDEYLGLLREHVSSIMSEGKSPDYPMSMTAAWKLSVYTLKNQLPQAQELLRCCAFFGPDPIPRDVFRRGAQAPGTGRPLAGLLANPILLASAIRELGRFALVTIDGRTGQVLTTIGNKQARNTAHTVVTVPIPNHRMNSGISADFGNE